MHKRLSFLMPGWPGSNGEPSIMGLGRAYVAFDTGNRSHGCNAVGTKPEYSVTINPTPDYAVKHKDKNYIVFVPETDPGKTACWVFERDHIFTIAEDSVRTILIEAAVRGVKVELGIQAAKKTQIVAVKIPAAPQL
jgi:hypothetical protein